jgi:hypothetical protein
VAEGIPEGFHPAEQLRAAPAVRERKACRTPLNSNTSVQNGDIGLDVQRNLERGYDTGTFTVFLKIGIGWKAGSWLPLEDSASMRWRKDGGPLTGA